MNPLRRLDNQQELSDLTGKICVEVGVYRGDFAKTILLSNPAKLYLVDCWEHQATAYDDVANLSDVRQNENYIFTQERFAGDARVELIKGYSMEASYMFSDEVIDFVYIDANHSAEACLNDMICWWPKIKIGGWITGHDYAWPSVRDAIRRFRRQEIPLTRDSWGIQKC
jgi:hypothetical protein